MTMTPQQIFDHVAHHLLTQDKQSLDDYGNCMYRGEGGTMCAVGCLIPDSLYDAGFEGQNLQDERVVKALVSAGVLPEADLSVFKPDYLPDLEVFSKSWWLLNKLQRVHDEDGYWPTELAKLGRKHNLTLPAILLEPTA